ncbi:t-SNARE [Cylindrobasidium torrendii FP15055 ss-10]|uniref:t-SNARE n=1 Tax=Cylindrobasidium torrendii FP15055 ss-10 TaxID=1314674 RepID=A0A0D7BU55_9AGAR|nr:t-SNARE [Cylindrobasidium torrendii FP15055 ss-10]
MSKPDRLAQFRARQDPQSHELNAVPATNGTNSGSTWEAFANELSVLQEEIERFNANVRTISTLHTRSLSSTSSDSTTNDELERVTQETRTLSNAIRDKISRLSHERTDQMRSNQLGVVRQKFMDAIQEYRRIEQDYSQRSKQRVGRQFRIVKPEATDAEIDEVVQRSDNGQQIFADAVLHSSYGEARNAYREVEARQQDLARMEQTIAELAALFSDMAVLVDQQDQTIQEVEKVATEVNKDTEAGLGFTEKAVKHARAARKKKIIFFWICVAIAALLALILGLYFGLHKN